jgi:DNA polymerase/3'-5' exonuclease PolX
MQIMQFVPYIDMVISDLSANADDNKFRLTNYKKWRKLLTSLDTNLSITEPSDLDTNTAIKSLPTSLKDKMREIIQFNTINGKGLTLTPSHNTKTSVDDIKLEDFYGFGTKTSTKFMKDYNIESPTILLDEWQHYSSLSPDNAILMLSKMSKPASILQYKWDAMTHHQKMNKLREELFKNLALHTRYLQHLNYHQLIGVKHYYNIMMKIPRAELIQIEQLLKNFIGNLNKDIQLMICGSYRRGRAISGDIDCLLTHPMITGETAIQHSDFLQKIVDMLTNLNFLVDHLTEDGTTKYMGLCRLPDNEYCRRIDMRLIPFESYAFATLYFTGSKTNNTNMRNAAKKLGYKLNEYGLYNILTHESIICNTEAEIFTALKLPYLEPHKRDID